MRRLTNTHFLKKTRLSLKSNYLATTAYIQLLKTQEKVDLKITQPKNDRYLKNKECPMKSNFVSISNLSI